MGTKAVYQVLVPSTDQALLAKDLREGSLADGQLGIFNYHTGLSVDGTVPNDARDIYIALGVGTGTTQEIKRSAGQMIQVRNARFLTLKPHTVAVAKVVELTNIKAKCETDYILKVQFMSQQSYGANGYNQFSKTFSHYTGCCTQNPDCDPCMAADAAALAVALATAVNADTEALVTAVVFANILAATFAGPATASGNITVTVGTESFTVAILDTDTATIVAAKVAAVINATTTSAYTATSAAAVLRAYPKTPTTANTALIALPTSVAGVTAGTFTTGNTTVTDTAAFIAANPGAGLGIRLTGATGTDSAWNGNIPLKYYSSKEMNFVASLTSGFECSGTVTTVTEMAFDDGSGNNIAYEEYVAEGWGHGGPYRTSSVTGLERTQFTSRITKSAKYNKVMLGYDQMSVAGWGEYLNNLETIIAVPCANTTTLVSLFTMFDLIFTQFGAMTNDAANIDCTNANATSALTPATDGIESFG